MPSPQPEMMIVVGSSAGDGLAFSWPLRRYTRSDIGVKPGNGIGCGAIEICAKGYSLIYVVAVEIFCWLGLLVICYRSKKKNLKNEKKKRKENLLQ